MNGKALPKYGRFQPGNRAELAVVRPISQLVAILCLLQAPDYEQHFRLTKPVVRQL